MNINTSNAVGVSAELKTLTSSDWVPADVVYSAIVIENLGSVKSVPIQVCCVKLIFYW